jgi:hypothetical protein
MRAEFATRRPVVRLAAAMLSLSLTAGCGPSWQKPGATQADLERDSGACRVEAELGVPLRDKDEPVMAQRIEVGRRLSTYEDLQAACLRRMGWRD